MEGDTNQFKLTGIWFFVQNAFSKYADNFRVIKKVSTIPLANSFGITLGFSWLL